MNVKEIYIRLTEGIDEGETLPVKLAYGISEEKDLYSLQRDADDYFFVGVVAKDNIPTVVFGAARKHDEFKQAIEQDIGKVRDEWAFGQINTNSNNKIFDMYLYPLEPNNKRNIRRIFFIFGSINPELLSPEVQVRYNKKIKYLYRPASKGVTKLF